ncbi:MAG TPA: hypothetical protein C5S37_14490 [Methanophagales archaeon]|nr:hypothetical protein [Methanophagales archaeon]
MIEGVSSLYYREMRIWTRTLWMVVSSFSTPILYLVLFGLAMGGLIPPINYQGKNISYFLFLLPGVIAMSLNTTGSSVSWTVFMDRQMGSLEQIFSSRVSRSAYGIAKILSAETQSFIQVFLILTIGLLIVEEQNSIANLPLFILSTFLGSLFFSSFYITLSARVRSNDLLNAVMGLILLPMMFCSTMFYPLNAMPTWLRIVAKVNPMTYIANCLRISLIGSMEQISVDIFVLCVIALLLFIASMISLRKIHIV